MSRKIHNRPSAQTKPDRRGRAMSCRGIVLALASCMVLGASAAPASADFSYAGQIGGPGQDDGKFDRQYGVAVSPTSGNLYVADLGNNRVQVFNPGGPFLGKFGTLGSGDGQFNGPNGLAFSPSGNLYITDFFNNRVEVFNPSGTFLGKFGGPGSGNGQFSNPGGIAVSPVSGNVYVADDGNSRVQEFTPTGVFITKFGALGSDDGQFIAGPNEVAVAPGSGDVYATDYGNDRVQQFHSDGTFVAKFGTTGSGPGQFRGPEGIAFSPSSGMLYVTEHIGNRVQQFSPSGTFITQFGMPQIDGSTYLAVGPGECVYVSDFGPANIKRFGSACPPPPPPAQPVVKPPPALIAKVVNSILPNLTCVDRRKFTFPVAQSKSANGNVTRATVFVSGKNVKTVSGANITKVTIRALPKKTFTVKVLTVTTKGFQITSSRTYRACRKGERSELKRKTKHGKRR